LSSGNSTDLTAFKELVRSRTSIVELVGETVRLESRRGGHQFVGLCPFHDDHNPSLTVDPERQSYKCWSCGEGGDCYSFVMRIDGIGFPEALALLADRAHLEMPRTYQKRSGDESLNKNSLYELLAWAEGEFHTCFSKSHIAAAARRYLEERGFTQQTLAECGIGYHPAEWEWLLDRARGKFAPAQLAAARLVRERRDGSGYYDDFLDRVLFPIRDERGRTVAFGGRILPGNANPDAPKYLNSAESPLFAKNRLLYGLDLARESIRRTKVAVVVEGYTDCMMIRQHGFQNVVGTLGTALTEMHVRMLKRFARKVVLVYDGDEAGRNAAERSVVKFLSQNVDLRVLSLPQGTDPADHLSSVGLEAFQGQIDQAPEAWEFKLKQTIDRFEIDTVDGRQQVLTEMINLLTQAPQLASSDRESILLERLAHRFGVKEQTIRQRLSQARSQQSVRAPAQNSQESREHGVLEGELSRHERMEYELLEILFADPQLVMLLRKQVSPAEFQHKDLRALLQLCYDLDEQGVSPSYERVTAELEDIGLKRLVMDIDELSRSKGVLKRLQEDEPTRAEGTEPGFLTEAIARLAWRRQEREHELAKGEMARMTSQEGELGEDAKSWLKQVANFNEKRATKKSTI